MNLLSPTLALLALAGAVSAQSFNVDIQDTFTAFGIPANTFGAAAAQPGTWVAKDPTNTTPTALTDINNVVTTVMCAKTVGSNFAFNSNDPGTAGDDQALLDDIHDLAQAPVTWVISNLAAGTYTLYTYTFGPSFTFEVTSVSVNGGPTQQAGGGAFAGYVQGNTHTVHSNIVIAAGGSITMVLAPVGAGTFGNFGGFQLKKNPAPTVVTPGCFGDGTGGACPCGSGAPGNGCSNSFVPNGANLTATGTASIGSDTMVLSGSGMPPTSSVLYFQGTSNTPPGALAGDGLNCIGGTQVRLGSKLNSGGASIYPGAGNPLISVKGGNVAGNVRHYAARYRDHTVLFCTPDTFNQTNSVTWTWVP